jgi:hypothetical protein
MAITINYGRSHAISFQKIKDPPPLHVSDPGHVASRPSVVNKEKTE